MGDLARDSTEQEPGKEDRMRVLICYATTEGQTRKIADFVADLVNEERPRGGSVRCDRGERTRAEPL